MQLNWTEISVQIVYDSRARSGDKEVPVWPCSFPLTHRGPGPSPDRKRIFGICA